MADSWARKADLPTPRGAVGANEAYDPGGDSWSGPSAMPTARDHVATAVVDGRIYVVGGRLGSMARNLDTNESYVPGGSWGEEPAMPIARHGHAAVAVGSRIYVLAGGPPARRLGQPPQRGLYSSRQTASALIETAAAAAGLTASSMIFSPIAESSRGVFSSVEQKCYNTRQVAFSTSGPTLKIGG